MTDDVVKAVAIINGLVLTGASALCLIPITPLPLDIALGVVAASAFGVSAWLAQFTIRAVRADKEINS